MRNNSNSLIQRAMLHKLFCVAVVSCVYLLLLPVTSFAQTQKASVTRTIDVKRKIPEGKWVLEKESLRAVIPPKHIDSDTVDENHVSQREQDVDIKELDIVIYTELEVKQDSIIFISSKNMLRTKYVYTRRTGIQFASPDVHFLSGGNVYGERLFVQQLADNHSNNTDSPVYILFTYCFVKEK